MTAAEQQGFGFPGYVPQTRKDVEHAVKEGLLSLDANVLLNFYRYSPAARDALISVLKAAGDRVWVSHQAAKEFWRNRCSAIDNRNTATAQLRDAFEKSQNSVLSSIETWAKQTAIPDSVRQSISDALTRAYEQGRQLFEAEVAGVGRVAYDIEADSVLVGIREFLTSRVGPPLESAAYEEAVKEGNRRAAAKIPPGYEDAAKTDSPHPEGAAGDFLVWLQSMKEAQNRSLPLVIVTGDEKQDWWWKHRSSLMGPRAELVEEFGARSRGGLFMLRPVQLIQSAGLLNVEVSAEAETDIEQASAEGPSQWTAPAVSELLRRLDAEGREQADVIRYAAEEGGAIDRQAIYELAGYSEERMLRGFTRPATRIMRDLIREGLLGDGVKMILTPVYEGGVTAVRFEIPPEVVEILARGATAEWDESSSA